MEKELEIFITELFTGQKEANKINTEVISSVIDLAKRVSSIDKKLDSLKIAIPPAHASRIEPIASQQPKAVIRKFQILLFPEQDAKLFYKIVFGRWFLLVVVSLFIMSLYRFSIHWSDNKKETEISQSESAGIAKAWNYLYGHGNSTIRQKMDSAMIKGNMASYRR